ncbi:type VI secretion system baseplate subunit TssF [Roseomonas sp. HJA6]|uniref:Type VI secretion system baseplate subunit TssF n=1 Tax=Roseomonas alba TaxID=2846776 RepID=A0ABS7AF81_9PROT|nr:type VI secretion system baseplate subunit TssF [Neoroseomonas alba]MBW6400964.1 type VI secretion system baseplate subunit TssF [Neoroseomonas alba]
MSESLLPYYNRELRAIRKLAGEFADAYPKVAARLRVTPEAVDDPYVERLLEGVAFIAARVQQRLDDELPEFSETLLEMLSPHLLAPVPSMTTLKLSPPPEAQGPTQVPRGLMVETEPVRGEPVRFSTCHDVTVWPVTVESFRLSGLPITAPANNRVQGALAVLRITLRTANPELTFAKLGLDRLRLHLRGIGAQAALLHELLCTSTLGLALADSPVDPRPTLLEPEALQPAGFAAEEAALPWPNRSFAGYRMLTEWFAFPEKFLYLDINGLDARTLLQESDKLDIFIYLSRAMPELERTLGPENVALGCTPAINLFPQRCEPISLDGTQSEWMVVPDARRPGALEIYSVEGVRESRSDGRRRTVLPFYRLGRSETDEALLSEVNYVSFRRGATLPITGTQTWIELRDSAFDPAQPAEGVLTVEALCCNRDLPALLPFGAGQPRLRVAQGGAPVSAVDCISPPTPTLRPRLNDRGAWRLISHLALNHLSVTGGEGGAAALREILRLHDLRDTAETRAALGAIVAVDTRAGIARLPGGRAGAFARGLDVTLTFDPAAWQAAGLYPLAQVLERFLALQVSVNAFSRTLIALRGRPGVVARFAPRSGTRTLL